MTDVKTSIDLSKLVGFQSVKLKADRRIDFRNDAVSGPVGAKVGGEPGHPATEADH